MKQFPKEKIIYKLINYKHNRRMLFKRPYRKYLDLAVIYEIAHITKAGQMFAPITNSDIKKWNIDETVLYEAAKQNTERILGYECIDIYGHVNEFFSNIETVMNEQEQDDIEKKFGPMKDSIPDYMDSSDYLPIYLISNKSGQEGVSCILYKDALKNLADKFSGDFYLVPNINEVAAVPAKKIETLEDVKNLAGLFYEMNPEWKTKKLLSERLYYYSKDSDTLDIIEGIVVCGKLSSYFLRIKNTINKWLPG